MNKQDEYKCLNLIYDTTKFNVLHSERPDFILSIRNEQTSFGIEITELFTNESHARVMKIPGYINAIFDKSEYRHKDDCLRLPKKKFTLTSPDNIKIESFGILEDSPKHAELYKLANEIIKKDKTC